MTKLLFLFFRPLSTSSTPPTTTTTTTITIITTTITITPTRTPSTSRWPTWTRTWWVEERWLGKTVVRFSVLNVYISVSQPLLVLGTLTVWNHWYTVHRAALYNLFAICHMLQMSVLPNTLKMWCYGLNQDFQFLVKNHQK